MEDFGGIAGEVGMRREKSRRRRIQRSDENIPIRNGIGPSTDRPLPHVHSAYRIIG